MNAERLLTVIRSPHVTEKSDMGNGGGYRQYAFKVARCATKPEIKLAIEKLFNVQVRAVTVCNMKGKSTRFGKTIGKHSDWKKAYVSLLKGQEINFSDIID